LKTQAAIIATILVIAGCKNTTPLVQCTSDSQCVGAGKQGRCTGAGFCADPDSSCPSGFRYDSTAAPGVGGNCVSYDTVPPGDMAMPQMPPDLMTGPVSVPDMGTSPLMWKRQTYTTTNSNFKYVYGTSATDIWALDLSTIVHGDGAGNWTPITNQLGGIYHAVCGSSANDLYFVGDMEQGSTNYMHYSLHHYTGGTNGTWSRQMDNVNTTGNDLFAIWCNPLATKIYAVGGHGAVESSLGGVNVWTRETSGSNAELHGVWGAPNSSDVWAVGQSIDGGGNASGVILHSTGNGTWTPETVTTPSSVSGFLAVWGSSSTDIYAAGTDGTLVGGVIYHSTGNGMWTPVSTGSKHAIWGLWGSAAGDIYAAGDAILHYNGASWSPVVNPGTGALAIWGSAAHDVYGVGGSDLIIHGM
jgi:hypothetical protein